MKQLYRSDIYFTFDMKYYPIINLVSRINDKMIIVDPDYKRGLVWSNRQQSRFIESILIKLPISLLFFEIDYEGRWVTIDGTQRLMAIKRLFDNELILSNLQFLKDIEKYKFHALPDNYRYKLEDYSIGTLVIDPEVSEQVKSALFERLNVGGKNISSQELRNYIYRKTSFPLLRRLRGHIENETSIIFPSVKKFQAQRDEFILRMLSFYFISEKGHCFQKLDSTRLDDLMNLIGNEDDKKLFSWFSDQCSIIDSAIENKGGIRLCPNKLTYYLMKKSMNSDNCLTMDEFLVLFGVACSLSGEKFQKKIKEIMAIVCSDNPSSAGKRDLFGTVNEITKRFLR